MATSESGLRGVRERLQVLHDEASKNAGAWHSVHDCSREQRAHWMTFYQGRKAAFEEALAALSLPPSPQTQYQCFFCKEWFNEQDAAEHFTDEAAKRDFEHWWECYYDKMGLQGSSQFKTIEGACRDAWIAAIPKVHASGAQPACTVEPCSMPSSCKEFGYCLAKASGAQRGAQGQVQGVQARPPMSIGKNAAGEMHLSASGYCSACNMLVEFGTDDCPHAKTMYGRAVPPADVSSQAGQRHIPIISDNGKGHYYLTCICGWSELDKVLWSEHFSLAVNEIQAAGSGTSIYDAILLASRTLGRTLR